MKIEILQSSMENKFIMRHSKSTLDVNQRERSQRKQSLKRIKFKQITSDCNSNFNQLNSKFNLYQKGCPNQYNYSIQAFKAGSILNQLNIVDSPFLDNVINQLKQPKEKTLNQRDYQMYPNLLKKSYKYKDMLSDKQQIKDFLCWFQESYQKIQDKSVNGIKRFHQKQLLLSAGFNQMIKQVSKLSKPRGQIFKMLWNRQNMETKNIIQSLCSHSMKSQKEYLQSSSQIHVSYQQEIQKLKKQNFHLFKKNEENSLLLNGHINSLRSNKKTLKKYEVILKKIMSLNFNLSKENLNLLQENTKLLMQGKQINSNQAKILLYRRLQLNQKRSNMKKPNKKQIFKNMKTESQNQVLQNKILDLQEKKQKLINYFRERMQKFPDQKRYVEDQYFFDQSFQNFQQVQKFLKTLVNSKEVQFSLVNQPKETYRQLKQIGVNTNIFQFEGQKEKPFVLTFDKSLQIDLNWNNNNEQFSLRQSYSDRSKNQIFGIINLQNSNYVCQSSKKVRQSKLNVRNSLVVLQLQKFSMFKSHKETSTTSNSSRKSKILKFQKSKQKMSGFNPIGQQIKLENASKNIKKTKHKTKQIVSSPKIIVQENQSRIFSEYNKKQSHLNQDEVNVSNQIQINQKDKEILDQLSNLVQKYLTKTNIQKIPNDPQKHLTKILNLLWKECIGYFELQTNTQKHNNFFAQKFLLKVKSMHHSQSTSYIKKFLSLLSIIKCHSDKSDLLQLVSMFLKFNPKFSEYDDVNSLDVQRIYFRLFILLRVKKQNQDTFNLWGCNTTLQKLKSPQVVGELSKYLSKSKITYIQIKMEQFVSLNALHSNPSKYNTTRDHLQNLNTPRSLKNKNFYEKDQAIISLNSTVLYILQIYLIQKNEYKTSYKNLISLLSQKSKIEYNQLKLLQEITRLKPNLKVLLDQQQFSKKQLQIDQFYKICVKNELPLFEQLVIQVHNSYKLMQKQTKNYFKSQVQISQWPLIKLKLQQYNIKDKNYFLLIEKLDKILTHKHIQGQKHLFSFIYQLLIINWVKNKQQSIQSSQSNNQN